MNDTALNLGFGIYRAYCLTKSYKTVYAKDVNRLNTAVFKVIEHIKPEFRAFMFADPYAENILAAVHVDTQDHIGGFGYILMVFFNFIVYRVMSRVMRKIDFGIWQKSITGGGLTAPWLLFSRQGAKGQGRRYAARLALDAL